MLRLAAICAAVLTTACTVESGGDAGGTSNDMLGRLCTMDMTVTGSFQQTQAPPVHADGTPYTGCWPIGVWTFQAQRGDSDCSTPGMLLTQYQFKVEERLDQDGNPYQVNTYMTDPAIRHRVKVSQGGAGLCEGELNLFSADGKEVWVIKPELFADQHIGGDGEYAQYGTDQWIGDSN